MSKALKLDVILMKIEIVHGKWNVYLKRETGNVDKIAASAISPQIHKRVNHSLIAVKCERNKMAVFCETAVHFIEQEQMKRLKGKEVRDKYHFIVA
ncbi:hypothetical protein OUZ56_022949 [Daphnia magna]|uniref:Uncharacterized protein n=1 Tax=Daphnia magna TaxID=35525 RepID=A0ABR0AXX9_9CRUS|nr:hypothetical protein OUZ56_022949 [Daphnia magna]